MLDTKSFLRRLALTMFVALLIVTAGCTGTAFDESPDSDTPEENTGTPENLIPKEGDDIRTVSFARKFGYAKEFGELDGSDPREGDRIYEPIEFAGHEDRYYNITMSSAGSAEKLRLIDPDGEVVAVTTGTSDTQAEFGLLKLNKTGKYTLHATSVEAMDTFEYSLSMNQVMYAGDRDEEWGEFERYSSFGLYTKHYWGEYHGISNATFQSANTSEDYVVIDYERAVNDNETVQSTHTAVMARIIIETRNFIANEQEDPDEWYPDRIYFRGYSDTGELVETNYVSQRWAAEYIAGGNTDTNEYYYRIVKTTKVGPAHNLYHTMDANETIQEDQFPHPAYPREYEDFPTA